MFFLCFGFGISDNHCDKLIVFKYNANKNNNNNSNRKKRRKIFKTPPLNQKNKKKKKQANITDYLVKVSKKDCCF